MKRWQDVTENRRDITMQRSDRKESKINASMQSSAEPLGWWYYLGLGVSIAWTWNTQALARVASCRLLASFEEWHGVLCSQVFSMNHSFTKMTFLGITIFLLSIVYLIFWSNNSIGLDPAVWSMFTHLPLFCCLMQDGTQFQQYYYALPYILYQPPTALCLWLERFFRWSHFRG